MFLDFKQDQWLDTAVSGIRFHLDRKRVRRELEGHLEDKKADLRRIFPDIPEAEAQSRALAAMGDPEELKTARQNSVPVHPLPEPGGGGPQRQLNVVLPLRPVQKGPGSGSPEPGPGRHGGPGGAENRPGQGA